MLGSEIRDGMETMENRSQPGYAVGPQRGEGILAGPFSRAMGPSVICTGALSHRSVYKRSQRSLVRWVTALSNRC